MTPFATVDDYEDRYGEVDDPMRVDILLQDASAFIVDQPGFSLDGDDGTRSANLVRIACAVVNRAVSASAGGWAGLSSISQGGGGYTESVSIYNPSGDFYLTKAEKSVLGIGGGRIGLTDPYGGGRDA